MSDRVIIEVDNHVADVILNRPEKKNALDLEMFEAIAAAADRLATMPEVRAVVLRGSGGCFCAGIDVSVFAAGDVDFPSSLAATCDPSPANVWQRPAYAWKELAMPVICAVEGVAFGGGLQIALGADVRFAEDDARLSIMESKWGLIPDMAISTTLRDIVPADRVKELAWTGRIVAADEARDLGLVTAVVEDPVAAARQLAKECAARSPDAMRGIKRLVNEAWRLDDRAALALEAGIQGGVIGRPNQVEAATANFEKRPAKFRD